LIALCPDLAPKPAVIPDGFPITKLPPGSVSRRLPATLPIDVKSAKTGQSAALRIAVPRVDHLRPFNEQEDEVLSVFAAV
jgi:hypothetical protein